MPTFLENSVTNYPAILDMMQGMGFVAVAKMTKISTKPHSQKFNSEGV